jgi:glutamate N-acetyltransferase / amino-acid N-acetyltransferase
MTDVSPLAPKRFPKMPPVPGVALATAATGVRYTGRPDVLFATFAPDTAVAGVLTQNDVCGAPVTWCRRVLPAGRGRALVVNAGNANVHTGRAGDQAVKRTAKKAASLAGCAEKETLVASTGVIGETLPVKRIVDALPGLYVNQAPGGWEAAARAIMTTDTFAKGASRRVKIGGVPVTLCGIAKGSGMIAPNMATMLAFIFTDANVPARVLRSLLAPAVDVSFNSITVDGDTSTSDTCLLFATRQAAHPSITRASDSRLADFRVALQELSIELAKQVICDGEGVAHFATIDVTGARSHASAKRVAFAIANSPLVKTAIAASDPNWGRIVCAAGYAGEGIDQNKLALRIGGQLVASRGGLSPRYVEAKAVRHMRGKNVNIALDIGQGRGAATVWTSDLTHGYIDINASYRS